MEGERHGLTRCRVGALIVSLLAIGATLGVAQQPQGRVITGTVVDERARASPGR
jgi:hypothetical protein